MSNDFDYGSPAELFLSKGKRFRRQKVTYQRFDTTSKAIRYAIEVLEPEELATAVLEVNEKRYDKDAIKTLYASGDYPLERRQTETNSS
jgi:hypothetical protein